MIGQRKRKLTKAEERRAYDICTWRDPSCVWCGAPSTDRDHRQNRQTGNTTAANLQGLCKACHIWKTEHPAAAEAAGLTVSRHRDYREWPARRLADGALIWVLYDDAGGWKEIDGIAAAERMR